MKKNSVVLGTAYGDCGKGHVTNSFSKDYDWVIRTSGANNCGHTIFRDGVKYVHNIIPSFDWRQPALKAFIGSGVVIDLDHLVKEVTALFEARPDAVNRLYIDPDAFTILPEHIAEDKAKNGHIGSTNRGVGPAYKEKVGRTGKRLSGFISENDPRIDVLNKMGVKFKHVLELETEFKNSALLFENAQGVLIELDHGTYPFVSCGSASLAGIHSSGFSFVTIDKVYGVGKVYMTKVGNGPFPTKSSDALSAKIAEIGKEMGATTGRKRDVGYLDLPALQYACKKAGVTDLVITKFDVLNNLGDIPVCVSYKGIEKVVSASQLDSAQPEYVHMRGWGDCSQECGPADYMAMYDFIKKIETHTGVTVSYVSTGVEEKDLRKWR